ncbi:MAG: DarT ssDNA thymidine ADP-ribosyltransferase family protein, partial [Candidatus Woesearchaeota archaeon]
LNRNNLKAHYPTDEQAEVLVKNYIPADSIISICFQSEEDLAASKAAMYEFNTDKFIVDATIFTPNRYK